MSSLSVFPISVHKTVSHYTFPDLSLKISNIMFNHHSVIFSLFSSPELLPLRLETLSHQGLCPTPSISYIYAINHHQFLPFSSLINNEINSLAPWNIWHGELFPISVNTTTTHGEPLSFLRLSSERTVSVSDT